MGSSNGADLYSRARTVQARIVEGDEDGEHNKRLNAVLGLLIRDGQHPITIGEKLGMTEKEVRDRVTLDTPGLAHSDPADLRYTAQHIEEGLRGQVTSQNFGAAPLLRVAALLKRMASGYEQAQAAQAQHTQRKASHG